MTERTRFSGAQRDIGEVLLDGKPLNSVLECDTKEGWAEVTVFDDDGHIKLNGENIMTEKLFGKVEYTPREGDIE